MSTAIMEKQLRDGLTADSTFASKGYTATESPAGHGVVVARRGVIRGLWQWQNGAFVLTAPDLTAPDLTAADVTAPDATTPIIEVDTLAEAIRYTRDVLCRDP